MSRLTVAVLQMLASKDGLPGNLKKADAFCRRAKRMGADIALMPEMWSIGYAGFDPKAPGAVKKWQARAVGETSPFVRHFQSLAKKLGMAIGVTYLQTWPRAPRNTLTLFDRKGKKILTYAKVHTCDFGAAEASTTPGNDFFVRTLETRVGAVKVGAMICYDREFPESGRILMLKGAELILTPNACTLEELRLGQYQARAYENAVAVAMANYAAPQHNGHSIAFDAAGMKVVEAGGKEGIYLAKFDLAKIRAYRQTTIWGNAFRRPRKYDELLTRRKDPVFRRKNALGKRFKAEVR